MLVRFAAVRAQCLRGIPVLGLFALACSLVVGELPPAEPEGGPLAGKSGRGGTSAIAGGGHGGTPQPDEGGAPAATAGSVSPSAGTSSAECDADGDKHAAEGACGGDDCDDNDADVFAGQTKYFDKPRANGDYDYNCKDGPQREYTEPVVCSGLVVGACPTQIGFLGSLPECGQMGPWGTCSKKSMIEPCVEAPVTPRTMRCH